LLPICQPNALEETGTIKFFAWFFNDTGRGVAKDSAVAYKWWLLAGAQGHKQAREKIDAIEKRLTPEQRAEGQRMAREFKVKAAE